MGLMVPSSGIILNSESSNLKEQNKNHKELSEQFNADDIEQLFETLAQWNEYLENHVSCYSDDYQEPEV